MISRTIPHEPLMMALGRTSLRAIRSLDANQLHLNVTRATWWLVVVGRPPAEDAHGDLRSLLVGGHVVQIPNLPWIRRRPRRHHGHVVVDCMLVCEF